MKRHEIAAEIAGTVLSVACAAGQSVESDDILLVLESMKMEIPVTAPAKGRIVQIGAVAGDVVQEGQLLLILES